MTDHYEVLGVPRDASQEEVRRAYKRKAQRLHPDRASGDAAGFEVLACAYAVLGNPSRRARYDRGEGDEEEMSSERKVYNAMAAIWAEVMDKPFTTDLVAAAVSLAEQGRQAPAREVERLEKLIALLEKQAGRVTGDEDGLFEAARNSRIRGAKADLDRAKENLSLIDELIGRLSAAKDTKYWRPEPGRDAQSPGFSRLGQMLRRGGFEKWQS
jgi:curved DNA-binding protein CbpA